MRRTGASRRGDTYTSYVARRPTKIMSRVWTLSYRVSLSSSLSCNRDTVPFHALFLSLSLAPLFFLLFLAHREKFTDSRKNFRKIRSFLSHPLKRDDKWLLRGFFLLWQWKCCFLENVLHWDNDVSHPPLLVIFEYLFRRNCYDFIEITLAFT